MPGLYKTSTKRKRPTLNSSQLNNTSIWHSTPIESATNNTDADKDKNQNQQQVEAAATEKPGEEEAAAGSNSDNDPDDVSVFSPPKRPTLGDGIPYNIHGRLVESPAAAAALMPPPSMPMSSTARGPIGLAISSPGDPNSEEDMFAEDDDFQERRGGGGNKGDCGNSGGGGGLRMHLSQRFGPVVINPPSGHSYFASILHKNGFILALPKNHLSRWCLLV
jgi:hypothetical protein